MNIKVYNEFEARLKGLGKRYENCCKVMMATVRACSEDLLDIDKEIEVTVAQLTELKENIRLCREDYIKLTGNKLPCRDYKEALQEMERLESIKYMDMAAEFFELMTKNPKVAIPLGDAKEILSMLLSAKKARSLSIDDEAALKAYALFVEKYKDLKNLSSKERFGLMQTLSPLLGEDLVVAAFMDGDLYGLKGSEPSPEESIVKPMAEKRPEHPMPRPLVKPEHPMPRPLVKPEEPMPRPLVKPEEPMPRPLVKPEESMPRPLIKADEPASVAQAKPKEPASVAQAKPKETASGTKAKPQKPGVEAGKQVQVKRPVKGGDPGGEGFFRDDFFSSGDLKGVEEFIFDLDEDFDEEDGEDKDDSLSLTWQDNNVSLW